MPDDAVTVELTHGEMRDLANRPYWRLKRAIDFGVALVLVLALAPVMAIVGPITTVAFSRSAPSGP